MGGSPDKAIKCLLSLSLLITACSDVLPVSAHKVQVAEDVGGTLHVEPNDNPQAGKSALAWVALTRKGGQTIPLEQCNCQLAVYVEPHSEGSLPILKPPLKPISAEGYKGVPGAEIVFPKAGAYELELSGTPKAGASFKPFQLSYQVTVAAGAAAPSPQSDTKPATQQPSPGLGWQTNAIALSTILGLGVLWLVLRRLKVKKH